MRVPILSSTFSKVGALTLAACLFSASTLGQTSSNGQQGQNPTNKTDGPEKQVNAGPLQPPKPYAGTKTLGNQPAPYVGSRNPTDPMTYWRNRIIGTGNGYGTTVIIVGGAPCYVPVYYGLGGFPGAYYGDSGYFANLQMGNLQFGLRQNNYGYAQGQQYNGINANGPGVYTRQNPYQGGPTPLQLRNEARKAAEREKKAQEDSDSDDDTYYLHQKSKPKSPLDSDPALAQAVADVTAAFKTGDFSRLERHIVLTENLTLQSKGRSRTPMAGATYLEMTRDALRLMKTARYSLDKIEPASGGAWMAYGSHVVIGEDGHERTFNVSFVFKKRGDIYFISEVSGDLAK